MARCVRREAKVKLDVGCGSNPRGDINVDFFTGGWNSQEGDQKKGELMNPQLIPNLVVAHAEFLPFRDMGVLTLLSAATRLSM